MALCHFQCYNVGKRCVVRIKTVICLEVPLKYPHGNFDIGWVVTMTHFLYASTKYTLGLHDIIPKTLLNNMKQTFVEGQNIDKMSWSKDH